MPNVLLLDIFPSDFFFFLFTIPSERERNTRANTFTNRLKVEDEGLVKDKLAAWACVRLDRLQQGYRFIDLKDARGNPCAGKLLVKIDKVVQ